MKPVQLWLPTLTGGAARPSRQRDLRRLHAEWDGHHAIWTQPRWNGPSVWSEERTRVGCISGEELECFRILHAGSNGGIVGPAAAAFDELAMDALLDAWLEAEVSAAPPGAGNGVEIDVPTAVEGGVAYRPQHCAIETGGRYPFRRLNHEARSAASQWPPGPHDPRPISPQSEAIEREPNGLDGTLSLRLQWNPPFESLMPLLPAEDDLFARDQMCSLRDLAVHDIEAARRSAEVASRDWIADGTSTVSRAWLQPIIAAEGELGAVVAIQSRFDVDYESLAEIYDDSQIRAELRKPTGVRRVLGTPGLMWALFLDRLGEGTSERLCELCGRAIRGRANKRFCGPNDSLICYHSRTNANRRRSRAGY